MQRRRNQRQWIIELCFVRCGDALVEQRDGMRGLRGGQVQRIRGIIVHGVRGRLLRCFDRHNGMYSMLGRHGARLDWFIFV